MGSIGERIKYVRKLQNMSQETLANELGISRTHISNMENGNDMPSETLLRYLSLRFTINLDWLKTGDGSYGLEWNWGTDDGLRSHYEHMKTMLDTITSARAGGDLKNTTTAFGYFVSLVSTAKLDKNMSEYLHHLETLLNKLERIVFKASALGDTKKVPAQVLLDFKLEYDATEKEIVKSIKAMCEICLSERDIELKL